MQVSCRAVARRQAAPLARPADSVSAATAELASQVQQMDATASQLRVQAGDLRSLVAAFRTAGERPALPNPGLAKQPTRSLTAA